MRITIDEVTGDGSVIRFTHEAGSADGVWRGAGRPAVGPADVELSVPGRLWWEDDIRLAVPGAGPAAEVLAVTGQVVDVSGEGVLSLRLGDGTLEVQTGGTPPPGVVGQRVVLESPLIEVTPLR